MELHEIIEEALARRCKTVREKSRGGIEPNLLLCRAPDHRSRIKRPVKLKKEATRPLSGRLPVGLADLVLVRRLGQN